MLTWSGLLLMGLVTVMIGGYLLVLLLNRNRTLKEPICLTRPVYDQLLVALESTVDFIPNYRLAGEKRSRLEQVYEALDRLYELDPAHPNHVAV